MVPRRGRSASKRSASNSRSICHIFPNGFVIRVRRPEGGPPERIAIVKIKLTRIYVDDQDKALAFYTDKLGFQKKADFTQGPYRWLTVASPEEPDGTELQLALNNDPAGKAYQEATFQQNQPAAVFYT